MFYRARDFFAGCAHAQYSVMRMHAVHTMELALEQLVTHIPDLVIVRPTGESLPQTVHSYGVIVFADISGEIMIGNNNSFYCGNHCI